MDCSSPGSSVHGVLKASILECSSGDVAVPGGHEGGRLPPAVPAACPPDSSSHSV